MALLYRDFTWPGCAQIEPRVYGTSMQPLPTRISALCRGPVIKELA